MSRLRTFVLSAESAGVLFDVDGTIADSDPIHFEAYNLALQQLQAERMTWADYVRECLERNAKVETMARQKGWAIDVNSLYPLKTKFFSSLIQKVLLRPGLEELLRRIRAVGIPVGLVSNGRRSSLEAILNSCWNGRWPEVIVSAEDLGIRAKPEPWGYELAASRMKRDVARCLVFEDAPTGIRAAKAAGMHCIGIEGSLYKRERLSEADMVICSFLDVRAVLSEQTLTISSQGT